MDGITEVYHGQVAQLVEQGTENPRVGGSIPSLATTFYPFLNQINGKQINGVRLSYPRFHGHGVKQHWPSSHSSQDS